MQTPRRCSIQTYQHKSKTTDNKNKQDIDLRDSKQMSFTYYKRLQRNMYLVQNKCKGSQTPKLVKMPLFKSSIFDSG